MYNNTCKEEHLQVAIRHDGERGNMDVNENELKKVAIEKFVSIPHQIKRYISQHHSSACLLSSARQKSSSKSKTAICLKMIFG